MRYNFLKNIHEKITRKSGPLPYIIAGVFIVVFVIILAVMRLNPTYDPLKSEGIQPLINQGMLRVGVRDNVEKFSTLEGERYSGFEDDLARKISGKIFGENAITEFVTVNNAMRNIMLSQNQIDCLIAVSPQNYSSSFIYSEPYYEDIVVMVVKKGAYKSIDDLIYLNIGALNRPSSTTLTNKGALTVLQNFKTTREYGVMVITSYSSIDNMFEALESDRIQAVAIENALLTEYYDENKMDVLPEAIGIVPYSIAAKTDQVDFINLCNQVIAELKESGEMDEMLARWNLTDYTKI